jgi:hypothetical protein
VLFHRDRVVGAALHRGVVGDDHALESADATDAGDNAARRQPVAVELVPGELPDLEERRAGVEQAVDAVAHEHLVARLVLGTGGVRPAGGYPGDEFAQLGGEAAVDLRVGREVGACAVDA